MFSFLCRHNKTIRNAKLIGIEKLNATPIGVAVSLSMASGLFYIPGVTCNRLLRPNLDSIFSRDCGFVAELLTICGDAVNLCVQRILISVL